MRGTKQTLLSNLYDNVIIKNMHLNLSNIKQKVSLLLVFSLLLFSCTERIDIDTKNAEPRLSVFGYITDKVGSHSIKITYTAGFFTTEPSRGISNAKVTISDGLNEYMLTENTDSVGMGLYQTDSNFFGIADTTYTLNISLDFDNDGNDERYQATAYMPFPTRVDSVALESSIMPTFPNLLLYGYVPENQENYLAVSIRKNKQVQNILDYLMILPDAYFEGNDIDGYAFPCFVNDGIELGDTVIFRVNSLSQEFADFLSHANSEIGGSNPIFGGPPADVFTNIRALDENNKTEIAGFFGAFGWDEKFTISEEDYKNN